MNVEQDGRSGIDATRQARPGQDAKFMRPDSKARNIDAESINHRISVYRTSMTDGIIFHSIKPTATDQASLIMGPINSSSLSAVYRTSQIGCGHSRPARLAKRMHMSVRSTRSTVPAAVLVVEDETLVRMVLVDSLIDEGYRVLEAEDAAEALTILADNPDTRAVITDVKMPGTFDGIELAHVVARRRPDVAIVVVSGHAFPQPRELPPGAAFFSKPYDLDQVRATVRALMEQAVREQGIGC